MREVPVLWKGGESLDTLSQSQVLEILDRVMKDITNRIVTIQSSDKTPPLCPNDSCTVYTTFEGGYRATLTLCVDSNLLLHLAQTSMQEENVSAEDLEDFAKEYFNVICGQVAARLFQAAHISSRFQIPTFETGCYTPEETSQELVLNYTSNRNEGAQLIHKAPSEEQNISDHTTKE